MNWRGTEDVLFHDDNNDDDREHNDDDDDDGAGRAHTMRLMAAATNANPFLTLLTDGCSRH